MTAGGCARCDRWRARGARWIGALKSRWPGPGIGGRVEEGVGCFSTGTRSMPIASDPRSARCARDWVRATEDRAIRVVTRVLAESTNGRGG
jgi:hypothetical protein